MDDRDHKSSATLHVMFVTRWVLDVGSGQRHGTCLSHATRQKSWYQVHLLASTVNLPSTPTSPPIMRFKSRIKAVSVLESM